VVKLACSDGLLWSSVYKSLKQPISNLMEFLYVVWSVLTITPQGYNVIWSGRGVEGIK
jgi:hypothetical protein